MRALAADEKVVTVMVYTHQMLARGELIAKENARVSIWLRTQGVSNYIHLHQPQVVVLGGMPPSPIPLTEIFIPETQVIGFHLAPPAEEPMDYDPNEANRIMQPLEAVVGTFQMKCKIRISSHTDLATSLDVMRAAWISLYDADISNPYLPKFNIHVPMLLVNPNLVSLGLA
jgi:hypothetical protein